MAFRENMSVGNLKVLKSLDLRGSIIGPQAFGGFGNHCFLNSVIGTDGVGKGGTKASPFATLDYAQSQMTADNDDTLHIMPKHAETITGAGGITLDVAGANIKGYGRYNSRPTFLIDGAAASMLVTAADVSVDNCVFNAGHSNLAYFALVTGVGFHFTNNYVGQNGADENFIISISAGAGDNDHDGLFVGWNEFYGVDTSATGCIVLNANNLDVKIIGNNITGHFGVTPFAPILMPDNEIPLNIEIAYNIIHNTHNADAEVGISVVEAAATGTMHHNLAYVLDTAGMTPFLTGATGVAPYENYYITAANKSGLLYPNVLGT